MSRHLTICFAVKLSRVFLCYTFWYSNRNISFLDAFLSCKYYIIYVTIYSKILKEIRKKRTRLCVGYINYAIIKLKKNDTKADIRSRFLFQNHIK